jgi:4,5-DOPA dioxygenase extradiol
MELMPVIFAAHGAPMLLDDHAWVQELSAWAKAMPKPSSIVMISAHWEQPCVTLGATRAVPLVYDFSGFPERFYRSTYRTPDAGAIARDVRSLLSRRSIPFADDQARGLDHGAYIPLLAMFPNADVPVLQLSLPPLKPEQLLSLGSALAQLREHGTLIVGSGFLTHNMRFAFKKGVPQWAHEFDAWAAEALNRFDLDSLANFRHRAPAASMALPTWEHYAPLLVAAGAAAQRTPLVTFPISGFWMDSAFTRRSVQFD